MALGFLLGLWIAVKLARRVGLRVDDISNLAVYCAVGGMLGAKLFMFLFDWQYYRAHPGEIFTLQTLQAAGVFHGGFIVAVLVAIFYMRRHKLPVLLTMDAFAPGVALGHAVGRLGCFAAGCCWGAQCDLPWAVRFHSQEAAPVPLNVPLHPVQLYEAAANLGIFAFLFWRFGRRHRQGEVISLYLIVYSTVRFIVEFFREHEQSLVGPFSLTQWIALALLAAGMALLLVTRRSSPWVTAGTSPLSPSSPTLSPGR